MTRADILVYLQSSMNDIAVETALFAFDDPDGYKLPIDSALRRIGATNLVAPVIATTVEEAVLALAEYYALLKFWTGVSTRIDMNTGQNFSVGRSQLFLHIKDLLATAADRCALLGYPVIASNQPPSAITQAALVSASVPTVARW